MILAVAGLLVVVGLLAGVLLANTDNKKATSTTTPGADRSVKLEPISSRGSNPFLPSVGKDTPDVKPPPNTAGSFPADTPGLYGGTMRQGACDPQKMVTFLQQNPDKAAAWASVLGIPTSSVSEYVSGLTPVVLRTDTAVTNHGYEGGRATTIPAVLQSGTAVLVDKYGQPVTKCYCGNPLTAPTRYSQPTYTGPRWSSFEPSGITIIQKTTVVINQFTLIDLATNTPFVRPAGTTGDADTPSDLASTTTTTEPTTLPSVTVPTTQTPSSATSSPPTSPTPTTSSGPSPQDRAKAKLDAGAAACYPFPAPIEDSTSRSTSTQGDGQQFLLEVVTQTTSGGTQVFDWLVDRDTLRFTPQNQLATVASNNCAQLN